MLLYARIPLQKALSIAKAHQTACICPVCHTACPHFTLLRMIAIIDESVHRRSCSVSALNATPHEGEPRCTGDVLLAALLDLRVQISVHASRGEKSCNGEAANDQESAHGVLQRMRVLGSNSLMPHRTAISAQAPLSCIRLGL